VSRRTPTATSRSRSSARS